ncbi:MAG: (Fe-S)-binding protein, partial [Gammaproteobacteria bacterium]
TAHALLAQLDNVAVRHQARASECCGFGGTFSVKVPEVSGAMVQDKVEALAETGADCLLSGDCGCMMNITGAAEKQGKRLPGKHIATFLWERTR